MGSAHVCRFWYGDCIVVDFFAVQFYLVAFARCWSGAARYVYGASSVFPVFMVWVYKSLILKFGGVAMYRRGQPFFIGLMVGYAFAVFFSTLIDHLFFYGHGHVVHDF